MEQNSRILLYALLGIVVVGGTIVSIIYRSKQREKSEGKINSGSQQNNLLKSISNQQADDLNRQGSNIIFSDEEIISQMMKMLEYFNGDMGALFSVVSDPVPQIASVIFDNLDAVINSRGSEMLKSWFSSFTDARKGWDAELYRSKAVKILSLLKQCGIQQSTELKLTWNENAAKHYRQLTKIEVGDVCEVLSPCWIYKNEVFEQGLVRLIING